MFERTFGFCKRLIGVGSAREDAEQERRLWVRYPADFATTVQEHDSLDGALQAQVRDISLGGANLVVEREYVPGQMISLELPADDDNYQTVLACVVRVNRLGPNLWSLGCTFSRELSDDDLEGFGARRVKHEPDDQRTWRRFPTSIRARCQPVTATNEASFQAEVLNLSASGVGLVVDRHVEAGTLLTVDLLGSHQNTHRTMLACVVHVTTQGPSQWALGCNFIHSLSEADLHALV